MRRIIILIAVGLLLAGCPQPQPGMPGQGGTAKTAAAVPNETIEEKALAARHIIYLAKGEEYPGVLTEILDNGTVVFINQKGKKFLFSREDVERIEFTKRRLHDTVKYLKDLPDEHVKDTIARNPLDELKEKYPSSNYITAFKRVEIDLTRNGKAVITTNVLQRVLRKGGRGAVGINSFSYLAGIESFDVVFARSISSNGNILNLSDNAFEDGNVNGGTPAYDMLHRVKFSLKEVDEGSWGNYCVRYEKTVDALHPLNIEEYFQDFEPMLVKKVVVYIREGDERLFSFIEQNFNNIEHEVEIKKRMRETMVIKVHEWKAVNRKRVDRERNMPPLGDVFPRLIITKKGAWQNFAKTLSADMEEKLASSESAVKLASRIAKTTDGEKIAVAKACYHYIQKQLDTVDVGPLEYSHKPHTLDEILKSGKGNAVDRTFLLMAMLREQGMTAEYVLVAPRSAGPVFPGKDGIAAFQVSVLRVVLDNTARSAPSIKEYFLSLGSEFRTFGYLPPDLQGAKALVITGDDPRIITTPELSEQENAQKETLDVAVRPDGSILVKKKVDVSGLYLETWRALGNLKEEERVQHFEKLVSAVHANARLVKYTAEHLGDNAKKPVIEIVYEVPDYAISAGGEMLVLDLPEIDYSAWAIGKRERTFPMWWGSKMVRARTIVFTVPEGYRVEYAGKAHESAKGELAISYRANFAVEGRTVRFRDEYIRRAYGAPKETYPAYISCIETRARVAKENIIFEKQK